MLFASSAFAQISGDGFYRVQNDFTKRYLHVMDNSGSINYQATSADVGAIVPYSNLDRALSDAASVIYIQNIPDNRYTDKKYDFHAQGISSFSIIEHYIFLHENTNSTYRCYATQSGTSLYLADTMDDLTEEEGALETVSSSRKPDEIKIWHVTPITANGDNYFGIKPTVTVGDKHYASFYASFGFNTVSEGMKVYKVIGSNDETATLKEVDGTVPAATPVIIECSSTNPSDNRIDLKFGGATNISDNILAGNYFCNDYAAKQHINVTKFDGASMRVLGLTSDGNVGFVKTTDKYLKANSSYLPVTASAAAEIKLEIKNEEDQDAINSVEENKGSNNVYNAMGVLVKEGSTSLEGLNKGLYIIGNKKVILK